MPALLVTYFADVHKHVQEEDDYEDEGDEGDDDAELQPSKAAPKVHQPANAKSLDQAGISDLLQHIRYCPPC